MADYKTYLASSILTEDKIVTYRLLSRALKVNVNTAKEMLYEFHRQQNGKKPGTIHATYLISGTKRREPEAQNEAAEQDGEDTPMQSSPFMQSSMPQPEESTEETPVLSITLVREENLEEIRSQYEHISSIHVYSIGPHPLKDLQLLSDITRQVRELCAGEDPLETASKYGTIINKNAKRREGRRPPLAAVVPPAPAPAEVQPAKPKPEVKPEPPAKKEMSATAKDFFGKSSTKSKPAAASNTSSKESTPNPQNLKRESSSIFKSFAKAKPKLQREGTDSSVADSPVLSPAEDSPMKDVSDDEEETYVPPAPVDNEIVNKSRKERKENEEKLRKMMEMEDEDEEEEVEKEEEEEAEVVEPEKEKEASVEKEVPPVVSGGRRRGRRRVMKKKTVKDEEGYLVTKEEPVWESFSEDEPAPLPKPKVHAPTASTKGKKAAGKAGQGSIMSFFGKK